MDIPDREILRLYLPVEDPEKIQAALAYDIGQLQSMAREMEEALQIVSSSGPGTSAPLRSSASGSGRKKSPNFCLECGEKLRPKSKFCPNCGMRIEG